MQPRRRETSTAQRIQWKLRTLQTLLDMGVWLVDACLSPVYEPGGRRRFKGAEYQRRLRRDWTDSVWPFVRNDPIERVWTIGLGVADALERLPGIDRRRVISQPGDRVPGRHSDGLRRLVEDIRQAKA